MQQKPQVCLCLTGKTLKEDIEMINRYRNWIDIAELRVDYLDKDERLLVRRFPEMAGLPIILTIRRRTDGGLYVEGEAARTTLFARALAFAEPDSRKNFAYIDLESDFRVPSLQDAALAFGTRIIRSYHNMNGTESDLVQTLTGLRTTGYEIPKLAFQPGSLKDVIQLFKVADEVKGFDHILIAMGALGFPSRILAQRLGSYITYTSVSEEGKGLASLGQIDPQTLHETYRFRTIDKNTKIYGITGYPLKVTNSPFLHNKGYGEHGMNAVYIPVCSDSIESTLEFADAVGMQGLSVTIPYKEAVLPSLAQVSAEVGEIGACNTIVKNGSNWYGYNTDCTGLRKDLAEFLGRDSLFGKRVAIIGAGGAARAAAYVVRQMHGKACIFNRTISKAKLLADQYGFKYAPLDVTGLDLLESYSSVIIQTTSIGMGVDDEPNVENDPIHFYMFHGHEKVYDVIYAPEKTPLLKRAEKAGCAVCNGSGMLRYQGYEQFKLFTGVEYE